MGLIGKKASVELSTEMIVQIIFFSFLFIAGLVLVVIFIARTSSG